jgi:SanA protein
LPEAGGCLCLWCCLCAELAAAGKASTATSTQTTAAPRRLTGATVASISPRRAGSRPDRCYLARVAAAAHLAWRPSWPFKRFPRATKTIAALIALGVALVAAANLYIVFSTGGEATGNIADVPHAEVAIVPGALVKADGEMSAMLADRVDQAAALWRAGKVDRILVSGDHQSWSYDEPDTMRKALVKAGVPPRVIFEDHAAFNTWASMVRAKKVFEVKSAVVVTQGFHMPRALYLADEAGLKASGLTADLHSWGAQGTKSDIREIFSRVKAIADTSLDSGVLLGPKIPISGPDGRRSWGPPPPEGTPPAGSPGR